MSRVKNAGGKIAGPKYDCKNYPLLYTAASKERKTWNWTNNSKQKSV